MTKGNQKSKAKTSKRDDENSMWCWFEDFVIDGSLLSFTDHAGIKLEGVPPAKVWDVFPGPLHEVRRNRHPSICNGPGNRGSNRPPCCEIKLERSHSARST